MEGMELQACAPQFGNRKPKNGLQQNQKRGKYPKRKPLQHSDDIVYSRGTAIQTMPSLSKQLKGLTACVIGLQYVWEYRSPSKSVPPHYHCKLCSLARLQHEMLYHIKGWKHSFRYMKKVHPEKVSFEEEDVLKDPMLKKTLKDIAAEVERTEGRGQLKVILKEPCDAPAFKGLRSATPRPVPLPPAMEKGTRFGGYRMDGFGGYPNLQGPPDYNMDQGPFHNDLGHNHIRGDEYGHGGFDGCGPSRQSSDYISEYRDRHIDRPMDRPMNTSPLEQPCRPGNGPDSGDLSNTLLSYLDTFKIENESDAQLVLKVTQKLTDVLMEYRLRNISGGPGISPVFSSSPSTMPRSNDQFSGYPGSSRYSDNPAQYYE